MWNFGSRRAMVEVEYGVRSRSPDIGRAVVIGILCLCAAGYTGHGAWRLEKFGVPTVAVVTKAYRKTSCACESPYKLDLQYIARNGATHEITLSRKLSHPLVAKCSFSGDKLPVIYDPDHPQRYSINTKFAIWMLPTLFSILGVGGLLYAMIFAPPAPVQQNEFTEMHV